jgi:hypothetical protein
MGGGGALYFERLTLERIKDTLGTGTKNDLWNEFLRACEAFGCGATSKVRTGKREESNTCQKEFSF